MAAAAPEAWPGVSRARTPVSPPSNASCSTGIGVCVPAAPSASTYRFLASQGVDAMSLDPSALELTRAPADIGLDRPGASPNSVEALDAFLAEEQRQILHEAVLEANQLILVYTVGIE